MIFVRRDPGLIPERLLRLAEAAQAKLEDLPPEERGAFIKKKASIWRRFAKYLSKMSYGKCWYSESDDPQAFFDVDHFRPKAEAQRDDETIDEGYPWLAFSWENFRYAAGRSNRLNTDENTELVVGKGSWFPLMEGSPLATWGNRCLADERPKLLDPTVRADVDLIDVKADGSMGCSGLCVGTARERVKRSIELYGLDLPNLSGARKGVMREVIDLHTSLMETIVVANEHTEAAEKLPIPRQVEQLRRATMPNSRFSKAARAQLMLLPGGAQLCGSPEDLPLL